MFRTLFTTRCWFVACVVTVCFTLWGSGTAAGQSTINQTSCVAGSGSCTTNGFLQDLTVNCFAGEKVSNALSSIADRNGPNRISLSGICSAEPVNIVGFNRLTIQAPNGATIARGVSLINSRNVTLRGLLLNLGNVAFENLSLVGSQVTLDGVTVKSAQAKAGISVTQNSSLSFGATGTSNVTGNGLSGINIGAGSTATVANVTISNNGSSGTGEIEQQGIVVHDGGALQLANAINGAPVSVDISGNAGGGILVKDGSLSSLADTNTVGLVHIHDNGGAGLELLGSAELDGNLRFDGNAGSNPSSQIVVYGGGVLAMGRGAQIQGGLSALYKATVILGDGGPLTLTGGAVFLNGATGVLWGTNSIDTLTCDSSSWVTTDGQSQVGANGCPSDGPSGAQGPMGPQGPAGPQGAPGLSGRQVVTSAFATPAGFSIPKDSGYGTGAACPAGKSALGGGFSFDNPSFVVTVSMPDPNRAERWQVNFQNVSNKAQAISGTIWVVCAITQ